MDNIVLWIKITPKPELFKDIKDAILNVIPEALKDPGCKVFSLHESDGSLYLYEIFENQEAYDRYAEQSYSKKIRELFQNSLATPPSLIKLSKLL